MLKAPIRPHEKPINLTKEELSKGKVQDENTWV